MKSELHRINTGNLISNLKKNQENLAKLAEEMDVVLQCSHANQASATISGELIMKILSALDNMSECMGQMEDTAKSLGGRGWLLPDSFPLARRLRH